jgi:hypothetical protein
MAAQVANDFATEIAVESRRCALAPAPEKEADLERDEQ